MAQIYKVLHRPGVYDTVTVEAGSKLEAELIAIGRMLGKELNDIDGDAIDELARELCTQVIPHSAKDPFKDLKRFRDKQLWNMTFPDFTHALNLWMMFKATGKNTDNLQEYVYEVDEEMVAGRTYLNNQVFLYDNKELDNPPNRYSCDIGNVGASSDIRENIEWLLFGWALNEGLDIEEEYLKFLSPQQS